MAIIYPVEPVNGVPYTGRTLVSHPVYETLPVNEIVDGTPTPIIIIPDRVDLYLVSMYISFGSPRPSGDVPNSSGMLQVVLNDSTYKGDPPWFPLRSYISSRYKDIIYGDEVNADSVMRPVGFAAPGFYNPYHVPGGNTLWGTWNGGGLNLVDVKINVVYWAQ